MTNHNERAGGAGRPVLWAVLALSLGLLVWLTFGLAIPNNPITRCTDRDAYGISKYQFLESCQEGIEGTSELTEIRSQLTRGQRLAAGDNIVTEFMIDSPELVDLVRPTAGPAQSWAVTTPIMLRSKDTGQPLGPVYVNCVYDRGAGQTLVHLQPGA